MYLRYLTVCKHIKKEKEQGQVADLFSFVVRVVHCWAADDMWSSYGLCQLASTIPAHSLHNVKNTKPWGLEIKISARPASRHDWVDLCNSFRVFHSVIGIAFLALHLLCLLRIVKQGHRPHTVKASTLGINGNYMPSKQFLDTETKAGAPLVPARFCWALCGAFSIRFLCSLATLKCSPESWLWPDCRRSHGFDLWHGR